MEHAAESLRTFSLDILGQIHALTIKPVPATKQELQDIASESNARMHVIAIIHLHSIISDSLENLEVMLHVIQTFGDELPAACQNSCQEAWSVFDSFLAKYGTDYDLCERTTRVLRHGLTLFGDSALPVAKSAMIRLTVGFDLTGFPSNLWIAGKIIQRFGDEEDPELRGTFLDVYEHSTQKVASLLQLKSPDEIPDGSSPL